MSEWDALLAGDISPEDLYPRSEYRGSTSAWNTMIQQMKEEIQRARIELTPPSIGVYRAGVGGNVVFYDYDRLGKNYSGEVIWNMGEPDHQPAARSGEKLVTDPAPMHGEEDQTGLSNIFSYSAAAPTEQQGRDTSDPPNEAALLPLLIGAALLIGVGVIL